MSGRRSPLTSFFGAAVAVSTAVVASSVIIAPATPAQTGNYATQPQFAETGLSAKSSQPAFSDIA